eukprot:364832-Chlamydomonas_euryale.AAC.4
MLIGTRLAIMQGRHSHVPYSVLCIQTNSWLLCSYRKLPAQYMAYSLHSRQLFMHLRPLTSPALHLASYSQRLPDACGLPVPAQVEKAPISIKSAVAKADAEAMKKQIEAVGGKVELA